MLHHAHTQELAECCPAIAAKKQPWGGTHGSSGWIDLKAATRQEAGAEGREMAER